MITSFVFVKRGMTFAALISGWYRRFGIYSLTVNYQLAEYNEVCMSLPQRSKPTSSF